MVDVIQIYKSKKIFEKPMYTSENRARFKSLKRIFESSNGFVQNKTLYLPLACKNHAKFKTANLIIIQDADDFNKYQEQLDLLDNANKDPRCTIGKDEETAIAYQQISIPKAYELFTISKNSPDRFDLQLDYLSNNMTIGIPRRENHKIGELKCNVPIRYKINGKSDFTMTGRKARVFYEFDYIFELIGHVDKLEFLEKSKIKQLKRIPLSACKTIDERKILK